MCFWASTLGGLEAFGWRVVEDTGKLPLCFLEFGIAQGALDAFEVVVEHSDARAAGIDSPLFWTTSGRRVGSVLRDEVKTHAAGAASTVQTVNSLRGACLVQGELCVCQIVEVLGLAPSTVSKHLALLSSAGLVEVRKQGRWAYYRLPGGDAGRSFAPLLEWLRESLQGDELIKRDAKVLEEVLALDPEEVARNQRTRARE